MDRALPVATAWDRTPGEMEHHLGWRSLLSGLAGIVMAVGLTSCQRSSAREAADWVYLRPVVCQIPAYGAAGSPAPGATTPSSAPDAESACRSARPASVPSTPLGGESADAAVILPYFYGPTRFVLGPADLQPSSFARSSVVSGHQHGYQVQIDLTAAGSQSLNRVASERRSEPTRNGSEPGGANEEAFEVNGIVVSTLAFQASSSNGTVIVSGPPGTPFTKQQAGVLVGRIDQAVTPA
jgi:hypothetical protein